MSRLSQLPLGVRVFLMFILLVINYLIFPTAAAIILVPFIGLEKVQSIAAGNLVLESDKYIFLFLQGVGSLGAFAFTALLFSQIETGFPFKRLKINIKSPLKFFALALLSIMVAQVFIQFLVELNQKIPVPDAFKSLVEIGKQEEKMLDAMLAGTSVIHFIVITLVMAVIPAIAEEFFFRGLLLGELLREKIHPAVAITVTGFIFSMAHIQFENFIAIWVLGAFLGYVFYITGSLWVSIAVHFTNNFLAVFLKYLYNAGKLSTDVSEASMPAYAVVISIIIFSACIFLFNKWKMPVNFEEQSFNEPTEL